MIGEPGIQRLKLLALRQETLIIECGMNIDKQKINYEQNRRNSYAF